MADDQLYPNAGDDYDTTFMPETNYKPTEDDKETAAAKAASYPVMENVAEWFEQQIASCDSIDNIQVDTWKIGDMVFERQVSIEAQLLAQRILKGKLMDKYGDFKEFTKADKDAK